MSQPAFDFVRQCVRSLFSGKNLSHRAKRATVLAVTAKHASTSTGTTTSDQSSIQPPLIFSKEEVKAKWDWLPLHTPYHAARKTLVLCHGNLSFWMHLTHRIIWI